jgi:pimeloyl-ACP methyl ester carboxylesterase
MGFINAGSQVYMVDLRGQGSSSGETCSYGYLDALDLKEVVEDLRRKGRLVGKVFMVGHSYGGAAAIQSAARIPEVSGVISLSAPQDLLSLGFTVRALMRHAYPRLHFFAKPFLSDCIIGQALRLAALRHGFNAGDSSALKAVKIMNQPILLVHGDRDDCVSVTSSRNIYASRPYRSDLWIYPKSNHWQYLDDDECVKSIVDWMRAASEGSVKP